MIKKCFNVVAVVCLLLTMITPATNPGLSGAVANAQASMATKGDQQSSGNTPPTPSEYLSYLVPSGTHISLTVAANPQTLYNTAAEKAQAPGPYRATVSIHGVSDLKRLQALSVPIVGATQDTAIIVVDRAQLEQVAKLNFLPHHSDLVSHLRDAQGLPLSMSPTAAQILAPATSDTDNDGLSDTEEGWWCTDPAVADSDNDTVPDGTEVQGLRDWVHHRRSTRPASGKPFAGWPPKHTGCYDSDYDSVPDAVEVYVFGLNPNRESTPRDKFDDGQKLFGLTNCPGSGGGCGYGALPRQVDWDGGVIFAEMPSWVKAPYDSPFVAAFPRPNVAVLPSSFLVTAKTTIQTEHTVSNGEAHTYGTADTRGTSDSRADTTTWNSWHEVSVSSQNGSMSPQPRSFPAPTSGGVGTEEFDTELAGDFYDCGQEIAEISPASIPACGKYIWDAAQIAFSYISPPVVSTGDRPEDPLMSTYQQGQNMCTPSGGHNSSGNDPCSMSGGHLPSVSERMPWEGSSLSQSNRNTGSSGHLYTQDDHQVSVQRVVPLSYPLYQPPTQTVTNGDSHGGALTLTHSEYQEHTISEASTHQFGEAWSNATAIDTAHAADMTFTYKISNNGSDYAREISNIAFNVFIGQDTNPTYTYFPAADIGGDGKFTNFMPGETHTYTSHAVPLSLDQMKRVDLGEHIYIVTEDFSYGTDELFYQDAINSGMIFSVDNGDGNLHKYVLPTWGNETAQDVALRFFPATLNVHGNMTSMSVPDYTANQITWAPHALSNNSWWVLYFHNLGDGTLPFRSTPASAGAGLLIKLEADTDLDGYSDRSENDFGTDPHNPLSHPKPQLVAATHSVRVGNVVTSTMSFLNMGNFDAYGIEAVMYSPDGNTTINDNTIGGSGRVGAGKQVVLGSRIYNPILNSWNGSAKPYSTGNYTGSVDKTYIFTATNAGNIGVGNLNLNWTDGSNSGTVGFGSGYAAPLPLTIANGVKIGFDTGTVNAGDTFTVSARMPRDDFTYTVNATGYITPVVVVSYNDPQGNHKFVAPVEVADLNTDLSPYAGQMLNRVGVQIATTQSIVQQGSNSFYVVASSPHGQPITGGHIYTEILDESGTVVSSQTLTDTFQSGPTIEAITFDLALFSPPYQEDHNYTLLTFLTDSQGDVIDSHGRFLASFAPDPKPTLNTAPTNGWNLGSVVQGAQSQQTISLVNTGLMPLNAVVTSPNPNLTLSGAAGIISVPPAGTHDVLATLDTTNLTGTVALSLTVRSNDTANQTVVVPVTGSVVGTAGQAAAFDLANRPWDKRVRVFGNVSANTPITFTQNIQADPASIEPCKIYDAFGQVLKGVGRFCSGYSNGSASYQQLFGDGSDGAFNVTTNQTMTSTYYTALNTSVSVGATSLSVANPSAFAQNTEILIHQSQGVGAGTWESATVVSKVGNTLTLLSPLINNYNQGGIGRVQVVRIPHYTDVTVQSGVTLTAPSWDGNTGGILVFRASGTTTINGLIKESGSNGVVLTANGGDQNSSITTGGGFRGSNSATHSLNSFSTSRAEGYRSVGWNSTDYGTSFFFNAGGGATSIGGGSNGDGGGGGSNGTVGTNGATGGNGTAGIGATDTTGPAELSTMWFGGGGGGGANDNTSGETSGAGGSGGAIIGIFARILTVNGSIAANGGNGGGSNQWSAGGGGAGGSILLRSQVATLGSSLVTATGGSGGANGGGNGGSGRIRLEYCDSTSGATNPPASTQHVNCFLADTSGPSTSQLFGDGVDGALTVTSNQTMTSTYYTALNASVGAGTASLSVANPSAFTQNTEVLVHQTAGIGAGTWESDTVISVAGSTLNLVRPLVNGYTQGGVSHAQVIRIPHYSDVTIQAGATLIAPAWDGNVGGLLVFRANGTLTLNGSINMTGRGFRGGVGYNQANTVDQQGEGNPGVGVRSQSTNGNGGGAGHEEYPTQAWTGGGGGGNGTAGGSGASRNGSPPTSGGTTAGTPELTTVLFGGGGGGYTQQIGGYGGGMAFLFARNAVGSGTLVSNGMNGTEQGGESSGSGGGAGGSILLKVQTGSLNSQISATGGQGGPSGPQYGTPGGNGGVGRVRIEYCDAFSGTANPAESIQHLNCFLAQGYGGSIVSFIVPDNVTNGQDYKMQFGRHYSFSSAGSIVIPSRVLSQTFGLATMDALITPVGVGGTTNLSILVGNQTVLYTAQSITQPTTINIPNFASAISQYIGSQPPGLTVDVPFAVTLDRQADVMLTNLSLVPASGIDLAVGSGDLQIGCPGAPQCLATEGASIPINVTVRNPGYQDASSAVVGYYAGDPHNGGRLLGNSYVPTVPAGGGSQATFNWDTSGFTGPQTLYAFVDPSNSISETLETDNIISQTLYVKTKPDLRVPAISLDKTDRVVGEPINVTATISNVGETVAVTNTVRMNILGERADAVVRDLLSGSVVATGKVSLSTIYTPTLFGLHTITMTADISNTVPESVETNNVLTRTVYVGLNPPDIDAGGGSDPAYTPTAGYGYLNGSAFDFGGNTITSTVRYSGSGEVQYRFDGIQPSRFYHLDGIFYQQGDTFTQTVLFDGITGGQPIPMNNGSPSLATILVPGAAYADSTMIVSVRRSGTGPAFVSDLALRPVQYSYIDAGSPSDLAYDSAIGWGYLGTDTYVSNLGGSDPLSTYRTAFSNSVGYRFDPLNPAKNYTINLTMYDGTGSTRHQSVRADGNAIVGCTNLAVNTVQRVQCALDPSLYAGDGSVDISVVCDGCSSPRVNEIALEEQTQQVGGPLPTPTPTTTTTSTITSIATFTTTSTRTNTSLPAATSTPTSTAASTNTAIATATSTVSSGSAFSRLQSVGASTQITVSVGSTFTLDLLVNSGMHDITVQDSYLSFPTSILQNSRVGANSCVLTNTVTMDLSTFDSVNQNQVCNGPGNCFGGTTLPGSVAFASGIAPGGVAAHGDFRVAQVGFCANTLGDATVHWQFAPPDPSNRNSKIIDDGNQAVHDRTLFRDYIVHVVPQVLVGHVTWQGRPAQPNTLQQMPITMTLNMSGTSYNYPNLLTDARGFFTATVGTLPVGTYTWWAKGDQFLANAGTVPVTNAPTTQLELGLMRAGDANNDNVVDGFDYNILRSTYGRIPGDPSYDTRADFNGDQVVDGFDYNLLRGSYGAPAPGPGGPQMGSTLPRNAVNGAYMELRPVGSTPKNGGVVKVGDKLHFELWVHGGANTNLVGQDSYLSFTNGMLQNTLTGSGSDANCTLTGTVTPNVSVFDTVLQNEVCNGPGDCDFRGIKVPAGTLSFASALSPNNQQGASGAFKVADVTFCATSPGTAAIQWQFSPPSPAQRNSKLYDSNGHFVDNLALYINYHVKVVGK